MEEREEKAGARSFAFAASSERFKKMGEYEPT